MIKHGCGAALRVAMVCIGALTAAIALAQGGTTYGPIGSETLWTAAKKINEGHHLGTTSQVAWALYKANPQAFDGAPGRIRGGATLTIPDAMSVKSVSAMDAYSQLNGTTLAAVPATSPAPRPALAPPRASRAPVSHTPPAITAVEVKPVAGGRQWIGIMGTDFRPGAKLELRDMLGSTSASGRVPAKVSADRIDYAGNFGSSASNWLVTVVNRDGSRSEPYGFAAGPGMSLALAPASVAAVVATVIEPIAAPTPAPSVTPVAAAIAAPTAPPMALASFAGSAEQATAGAMLRDKRTPSDVYIYLAAFEEKFAGDVDYDYALGANAYDAGRYDDAVFVLQRAVAMRPKFSGARMELARAYYGVGDNESARREFSTLEGEAPPPEAARAIAEYLDAIDRRAAAYQRQLMAFLEVAGGYDSNANGGPDTQTFLGFALDARNQSTATSYYGAAVGGTVSLPLSPNWRVMGDGLAGLRSNPDAAFVDSQNGRLAAGLEWAPDPFTITVAPSYTYSALENDPNHTTYAADLTGAWALTGGTVAASARYAQTRYVEDVLAIQDVDTIIYGLSALAPVTGYPVQFGAALTQGRDDPRLPLSQFGRDLNGGRLFAIATLGSGHGLLASVGTLKAEYDSLFLGSARTDEQMSGGLGYQFTGWRSRGWTLGAQLSWTRNQSTLALYEYERIDAGLSLRREFK